MRAAEHQECGDTLEERRAAGIRMHSRVAATLAALEETLRSNRAEDKIPSDWESTTTESRTATRPSKCLAAQQLPCFATETAFAIAAFRPRLPRRSCTAVARAALSPGSSSPQRREERTIPNASAGRSGTWRPRRTRDWEGHR